MRMFIKNKWFSIPMITMIIFMVVSAGCGGTNKITTSSIKPAVVSNKPHPPAKTGDMKTGTKIKAATQAINPSGGTITVSKQGDPLDGFAIDVPSSSYSGSTTFNVSYAPITSQTFGSIITPISPMIYVDNGGAYANEIMEVQVPVAIPADSFAMGIMYDDKTKTLEGMPLIAEDANSITVATRHFSNFFITLIRKSLLDSATNINTGFSPGLDDWEFTNYGTYIARAGQCAGQSESAMWYYVAQPDGPDVRLFGAYDNNGNTPATPDFWKDDSLGYRFASTIQDDIDWDGFAFQLWKDQRGVNDELTWDLFVYSMEFTGEPQMVGLTKEGVGGHAMICYRINNGNLYVADPNYPGNSDRKIEYIDGKLQPYDSALNAEDIIDGSNISFDKIGYTGKTTIIDWDKISERWEEFKNGTIGNDRFPDYQIVWTDANNENHELTDGYVSPNELININVICETAPVSWAIYRDGVALNWDAKGNYVLNEGDNRLGIEINGQFDGTDADGNPIKIDKIIDFQYINVNYTAETPTTTNGQTINVNGSKTNSNMPEGAFGTPGNPYVVTLSGKLKGDPSLQYKGVEYYNRFSTASDVMAFEWSIPKPSVTSSTSTTAASLIRNLGADGLTIKFNDPKEKSVVRTDASNGVSTTTTITWLGWGDGAVSTTGSNYQWSNGGSITRALIASLDTSSSADPDFSIMGTVSSTIIHLTAKFRVQVHTVDQNGNVSDSDNNYTGPETVAIRLVPR